MHPSSTRVASYWLRAGVLEPPPVMVKEITEWVLAVTAARGMTEVEGQINHARNYRPEARRRLQELSDALTAWEAQPDSWKAYNAAYGEMWVFGHPGTRWSIRMFQKMTPQKRADLVAKAKSAIASYRERIEADLGLGEAQLPRLRKEQAGLRAYMKPGVPAPSQGEEVTKRFAVDLTGWRYGEHLKDKVENRATEVFRGPAGDQMRAVNPDMFENMMSGARDYWSTITVTLAEQPVKKERAHWEDARRRMRVVLPQGAAPHQLRDLEGTLKHELRHFSQGYLNYAAGYIQERFLGFGQDDEGRLQRLDRRLPAPGLPSRHIMTPDIFQSRDAPATLMQQLKENLKADNVPTHIQRAILRNPRIDLHALDDVEFYTRLADAIYRFEGAVRRAPAMSPAMKSNMVKLFTGAITSPLDEQNPDWSQVEALGGYETMQHFKVSPFFKTLLQFARGKWRKAVGELTKAVI